MQWIAFFKVFLQIIPYSTLHSFKVKTLKIKANETKSSRWSSNQHYLQLFIFCDFLSFKWFRSSKGSDNIIKNKIAYLNFQVTVSFIVHTQRKCLSLYNLLDFLYVHVGYYFFCKSVQVFDRTGLAIQEIVSYIQICICTILFLYLKLSWLHIN